MAAYKLPIDASQLDALIEKLDTIANKSKDASRGMDDLATATRKAGSGGSGGGGGSSASARATSPPRRATTPMPGT